MILEESIYKQYKPWGEKKQVRKVEMRKEDKRKYLTIYTI